MNDQPHARRADWLGAVSEWSAIGVFGIGCLVLAGWIFDVAVLKNFDSSGISMKANTAVAFILSGISLWLLQAERACRRLCRYIGWASASAVAVMGLLVLVEYLCGWDLRIDQLLFTEPAGADLTVFPGRMAPNSALTFVLIGLSLLLLEVKTRRGHRPAQYLIGLEGCVVLIALVGYLYGALPFYSPVAVANPMSLAAVLAGLTAFVGLCCVRRGPCFGARGRRGSRQHHGPTPLVARSRDPRRSGRAGVGGPATSTLGRGYRVGDPGRLAGRSTAGVGGDDGRVAEPERVSSQAAGGSAETGT